MGGGGCLKWPCSVRVVKEVNTVIHIALPAFEADRVTSDNPADWEHAPWPVLVSGREEEMMRELADSRRVCTY